jgi:hypothetical protein
MPTPPFYNFRTILEEKITSYLSANITGVAIHKGITDEVRVIPIIICHAESSKAVDDLGSNTLGNYTATLKIFVYSSADDETLDTHRARVVEVMGYLRDVAAIQATFNPTSDGHLYDMWVTSDEEGMSQRRYGNALEYTVWGVLPSAP